MDATKMITNSTNIKTMRDKKNQSKIVSRETLKNKHKWTRDKPVWEAKIDK